MLFAQRDHVPTPAAVDGLPELAVSSLTETAAHELLRSVVPSNLDHSTAARIVTETAGNPLAIVELAIDLSRRRDAGGFDPLRPLPLSVRLEARFIQAVRHLPDDAQRLLLLAAVDPTGSLQVLHAAAAAAAIRPDAYRHRRGSRVDHDGAARDVPTSTHPIRGIRRGHDPR